VKRKVSDAKKMLQLWKSSYLETRAKIEASGRDSRWEFDRKKLFEKTDHMADVCDDLYHIAQVRSTQPPTLSGMVTHLSSIGVEYGRYGDTRTGGTHRFLEWGYSTPTFLTRIQ